MLKHSRGYISIIIPILTLLIVTSWYVISPTITEAEKSNNTVDKIDTFEENNSIYKGKYVLIHLDANTLILKNGTTTITTIPLVSQGKPGSYYETIGGLYFNDYKLPIHFSSIGHVYMPYSIHIFGNYFIHGIPYYPDGTKVSSEYSGGCIRLADKDAELVYNFITPSMPIIITSGNEHDFTPTKVSTTTISSFNMTRLMTAIISLELLTQDNTILDNKGIQTTRRNLLPKLLTDNNIDATVLYNGSMGNKQFVEAMNNKAKAIGLTNTIFIDVNTPVKTTKEDYGRFMEYIITYKSYLNTVVSR